MQAISVGPRYSEAQISIIRRASGCELEAMEGRMSAGVPVDPDQYGRLAGRLCRMFELIGVRRLARPTDPLTDLAEAFKPRVRALDDDELDDGAPPPLAASLAGEAPNELSRWPIGRLIRGMLRPKLAGNCFSSAGFLAALGNPTALDFSENPRLRSFVSNRGRFREL